MSPYLEDHYSNLAHLYRRPLSFTHHCDRHTLDRSYLFTKNCSDMCVTLKMNDVVGGRRHHGYMRGCLSDIIGYNTTLLRRITDQASCLDTTIRDLFLSNHRRIELEPTRY
ncbi:hypothetical protein WR25_24570 [Diploscapter pachys]|uniref:Uncharacterized protein n=1 Tax=Diploscapter pachys TaxID=2018661 RepID=A0A2A2LZ80_9BILA|nr:hypothetical protein WR25_06404 [Diploscapter pachys]PAV91529.1 hypothetical protein WR25_24570 [Diploscapter pachys]